MLKKHGFDARLVLPDNDVVCADRETLVDEIEALVEIAVKHSEEADTANDQYEQLWGDKECISSLSKITTKDVENFEFVGITPSGGKAFYSEDLDVAVIHYGDYLRVYYDRVIEHGKTPICFSKSIINRII